ncbi:RNA polymerase subunit sigma [Guptibacillus algicola]|uniref:RNA polymerase subunit sigma n=1 Tax=Guptibacillus algicola TaxID=225844 RepID=UPI001CD2DFEF|nr:RNA polymerase subunit sigma [Alkalihalobacillus algicola]MCA0988437.1 RNA polymerase subunit sigma [Alkalihalobacillus algicola]
MKKRVFYSIVLGFGLLVGCSDEGVTSNQTNKEDAKETVKEVQVEMAEVKEFTLDAHEMKAYENFAEDLNEEHLTGLEPISIAKLHIYASLQQDHDVHYALYTDREGHVKWSKEEDEKIPESDRGTKESMLTYVEGIQDGEFKQMDDVTGYIEFHNSRGTSAYQMIKDESGIWKVAFMPIQ